MNFITLSLAVFVGSYVLPGIFVIMGSVLGLA
jgi:hypothetical protein